MTSFSILGRVALASVLLVGVPATSAFAGKAGGHGARATQSGQNNSQSVNKNRNRNRQTSTNSNDSTNVNVNVILGF